MSDDRLPVDPGLLDRFRVAGRTIQWRAAPAVPGPRADRTTEDPPVQVEIAHFHDEEARIERWADGATVDSGPLGALVLLLAMDERGLPQRLVQFEAKVLPAFPTGALSATWSAGKDGTEYQFPVTDVITLARYALA
jgi:hypothetical protein